MRLLVTIIIIILFSLNNLFSQEKSSPVEIPILLSGTFGEFRKTHFHTGVDIKTQGKEGLKIRAIDDGDLIRVKVSTSCLHHKFDDRINPPFLAIIPKEIFFILQN